MSLVELQSPIKDASVRPNYGTLRHTEDQLPKDTAGPRLGKVMVVVSLIKGLVGPAVLYMPSGFKQAGYGFAIPMLLFSWGMLSWSVSRLLETWSIYRMTYPEMMGRALGVTAARIVRVFIGCNQLCLGLSYFIFISQNLHQVTGLTASQACVLQLGLHIPTCWIRDIRNLRHTNLLANLLILLCIAVMMLSAAYQDERSTCNPELFNKHTFYEFVGTSVFIWEGAAVLAVPLQTAVKPNSQHIFPGLFVLTTLCTVMGHTAFSLANLCAYGQSTQVVLTENMSPGHTKSLVQIAFCIAVSFTLPLQLSPALAVISEAVVPATEKANPLFQSIPIPGVLELACRTVVVLLLCGLAILLVDQLSNLVAVVGCMFGVPLTFICPCLIHRKLVNSNRRVRCMNLCVIILGSCVCVITLMITLYHWD